MLFFALLFALVVGLQDRATVRADAPFIGVCAAVYMPELMACIGHGDPLKLRERLLVVRAHAFSSRSNFEMLVNGFPMRLCRLSVPGGFGIYAVSITHAIH